MYKLTHAQYFEALREEKLLGLKCFQCNACTIPPKRTCQECGSPDLEPVRMNGFGVIVTFTVVRVPPEGMEAPYVVALVELEEGPWLMGTIEGIDPGEAGMGLIGKRVKTGHKVVSGMKYTACEGVVPVFSIVDSPTKVSS